MFADEMGRFRLAILYLGLGFLGFPQFVLAQGENQGGRRGNDSISFWVTPHFTPLQEMARLKNPAVIQSLSGEVLPFGTDGFVEGVLNDPLPLGHGAGPLGSGEPLKVILWVFVTKDGTVGNTKIHLSSEHQELDIAALQLTWDMEFEPARNRGRPVPVWFRLPYSFWRARGGETAMQDLSF